MKTIEINYHLHRMFKMIHYKGFKYTLDYLLFLIFYNSDFLSEKLFYRFYPKFVFYPRYIEVEVSTFCNLRCKMCEHTYWREKPQHMTFEQLKYIVDQFPKLKWIGLTGIGESFLNPDFPDILRYVKKEKKMYLELYDNFYLIDQKMAKLLIDLGIDRMIVSLEAVKEETYHKLRAGSNFKKVIKNLKYLKQLRDKMNNHYPEIVFHYIVSKDNLNEMIPYIKMVKNIMGEEKTSILFTGVLHFFKQIKDMYAEIPDDLVRKAVEEGKRLGIRVVCNRNVPEQKDSITRCNEWTMPFIHVDGTVIPCCATNESNKRGYQRETAMGNIFQTSFGRIWNNSKYRRLRNKIHQGKVPDSCTLCTIYDVANK